MERLVVDIPGNSTTGSTVTVGSTTNGSIESGGDHDWFRVDLTAGQSIQVTMNGLGASALEDPYLRIRDANGTIIYENDDNGAGRNAFIAFQASYTGVYYIDAAAWDDDPPEFNYTGDYELKVETWQPPPVGSVADIAGQLVSGYWNGDSHHFDVTEGGTLTVNLTALTAGGQSLALSALSAWTRVIGVRFTEVTTGGQIVFDDNEPGAFASAVYSNGITTSARVNVSALWHRDYGSALNTYTFQTFIHEIGHALGLGHGGDYNDTARYPYEARFQNDSWPMTVMSYFDQSENSYFANLGFTVNFANTPMMADIQAMATLYGLSKVQGSGDTTYTFGPAGSGAQCIYDAGGVDWIYGTGYSGSQRIDLNPGTFSNINGDVGNVSIALGVSIENAVGGAGSDTIIGNSAANRLEGGNGDDILIAGAGDDALFGDGGNDRLDGGAGSDTAEFYSAESSMPVTVNLILGSADRTGGGGHDVLISIENVGGTQSGDTLIGDGAANSLRGNAGDDTLVGNGGDDLLQGDEGFDTLTGGSGNDSFLDTTLRLNGDTITDFAAGDRIVFTNADMAWFNFSLSGSTLTYSGGSLTLSGVSGTLFASAVAGGGVQLSLQPPALAVHNDFNGDGRSDILWRDDAGQVSNWLATSNGGFNNNPGSAMNIGLDWTVAGTGDFNGDGAQDILWRHASSGQITQWLANGGGGFTANPAATVNVGTDWHLFGIGDFNGDGRSDLLWQQNGGLLIDWLGKADGSFTSNSATFATVVGTEWRIVGTNDYNGDGRDDILWRKDGSGQVMDWLGTSNGGFTTNSGSTVNVGLDWRVAGTGDFNGDGIGDILWRQNGGLTLDWLGTASGAFRSNSGTFSTIIGTEWRVVGIGDYNGDSRDDILWRQDGSGHTTDWLGTANGGFNTNAANFDVNVPASMHVQDAFLPFI